MPGFGRYCSLEGHDAAPPRILDGMVDDGVVTVIPESPQKRAASDCVPRRLILAGTSVACSSCVLSFATQLAFGLGRITVSRLVGLVVAPPVVIASAAIVLMRMMSMSDEVDVQNVLVSGGNHLVHISSSLLGASEGTSDPLMEIRMTHVIVGHGTATRSIGGFSFSHAERYRMRVPVSTLQRDGGVTVPRDALVSKGQAHVPDLFEVPLCELLGDWPEQSDWMWATPMCGGLPEVTVAEAVEKEVAVAEVPATEVDDVTSRDIPSLLRGSRERVQHLVMALGHRLGGLRAQGSI